MSALSLLSFRVSPERSLSSEEQALLRSLAGSPDGEGYLLEVVANSPFPIGKPLPSGEPAVIESADRRIRLTHSSFAAEVDPFARHIRLFRANPADTFALQATLRASLTCALPLLGGITLHCAGVVIDGAGHLFYGKSGAGKSTLASRSPYPLLSDEMVAVFERDGRWVVSATGFWGTLDREDAPHGFFPLASLTRIRKGDELRLNPLRERQALLEALLVPAVPELWTAALEVALRLLAQVPHYELTWSLLLDPWTLISANLTGEASRKD